jgi:hypothetical protein
MPLAAIRLLMCDRSFILEAVRFTRTTLFDDFSALLFFALSKIAARCQERYNKWKAYCRPDCVMSKYLCRSTTLKTIPILIYTDVSSTLGPISNLAPVLALTSSRVAPGINSLRVIFPAFRSISKTACSEGY